MSVIFDFIKEHWGSLIWGVFALIWVIVRLTPSTKDDQILKFIEKVLQYFIPDRKKHNRPPDF